MLNLKKGLAIVLAAVTAFTFAPVANLGASVDAEAGDLLDTDLKSININVNATRAFKLADITKLAYYDSGQNDVTAAVSDDNIATVAVASAVSNGQGTISGSAAKSVTLGSGAAGVIITGKNPGNTVLTVSYTKKGTNEPVGTQTIQINVDANIRYLTIQNGELDFQKIGNAFMTTDTPAAAYNTKNTAGTVKSWNVYTADSDLTGYTSWVSKVETSNKDVAVPVNSGETNESTPTSNQEDTLNVKPQVTPVGVGEATFKVSLIAKGTGKADKTVATGTFLVKVTDANDELSVAYDGNRDGSDETAKLSTSVGAKKKADTSSDGIAGTATYNNNDAYSDNTEITSVSAKAASTIYLDTVNNKTSKITAKDSTGKTVHFDTDGNKGASGASGYNYFTVDNAGNVSIVEDAFKNQDVATGYITVWTDRTGSTGKYIASLAISIPVVAYNKEAVSLQVADENSNVLAKTVGTTNYSSSTQYDNLPKISLSLNDTVKTKTLTVTANSGDAYVQGRVNAVPPTGVSGNDATDVVTWNNATKTLTAAKYGKAILTIDARNNNNTYGSASIKVAVEVVTKHADNKITAPANLSLTASNKEATIAATTKYATKLHFYTVDAVGSSTKKASSDVTVDESTGKITYNSANSGSVIVRIDGDETNEALAPSSAYVTVNYSSSKAQNPLNVTSDKTVNLKVGETSKIVASGSSISYKSANDAIATVASDGTITGVAYGATVITVASPETTEYLPGEEHITVIVSQDGETTAKPAKVTGVKVSNKKGAYVSVKWKSQGKNINYRIWKKVGNGKWVGKNVAGSKATLSVKKGAKVQVKVKAYVKDSTGKTTWGPKATKAKTFKTDKK